MGTRLGVMGGTFDPIHHGHLVAASEVAHLLHLDEVVFVPAGRPWQKDPARVTEARVRQRMVALATEADPRFTVSSVDLDRPGPTYAVDTIRDLGRERPGADLHFITGADALASILTWRDPEELLGSANLVGVTRSGHPTPSGQLPIGAARIIQIPALAISSTDCRERVARGAPIRYLVPDPVERFVAESGLYRAGET